MSEAIGVQTQEISIHISQLIELQKSMPKPDDARNRTKTVTLRDQHGNQISVMFQLVFFRDRWAWKPLAQINVLI